MKTYEITIERTEVTILYVDAQSKDEAETIAYQKWETAPVNYGLGTNGIVSIKEIWSNETNQD